MHFSQWDENYLSKPSIIHVLNVWPGHVPALCPSCCECLLWLIGITFLQALQGQLEVEQILKNCLKLQEMLWDRQGLSQCHVCSLCLFQSGRGERLCCAATPQLVSVAEPEPPTATGTALTALSSHAMSDFWQHCKEKSVLALEQQEMGQLRGYQGSERPPLSELGGRSCLLVLNPPIFFFFVLLGSNAAEMKLILF